MCGILFYTSPDPQTVRDTSIQATEALHQLDHRGPDESNLIRLPSAILGHTRLSIIDISESKQPMSDPTERYHLTFNGEIYNYKEIRSKLKNDWHFKTSGDTETLLAALVIHGISYIDKIEGMFAFVFWDNLKNEAILCRDRLGKKPLYCSRENNSFAASSELPSLLKLRQTPQQECHLQTYNYFSFGFLPPGKTIYKDIFELQPGEYLTLDSNLSVHVHPYWKPTETHFTGSLETAKRECSQLLHSAIEKRLVSDVEIGAFLSGGIDSSLLVALMCKKYKTNLKTFTVKFSNSSFDESQFAQQIADHFHTEHIVLECEHPDYSLTEEAITKSLGQPFADPSLIPTLELCRHTANHVKVAISGDGGDELFCGYQRYKAVSLYQLYTTFPKLPRRLIERLINLLPSNEHHHSKSILKSAKLFLDIANEKDTTDTYFAPRITPTDELNLLIGDLKPSKNPSNTANNKQIKSMMLQDIQTYLPQDILVKTDRASMLYGLEVRAPFLDHHIVEFALSLPTKWQTKRLKGKQLLETTFKQSIPDTIWKRKKQGFAPPISTWLKGKLGDDLLSLSASCDTPLSNPQLQRLIHEHRSDKRDHSQILWATYTYLCWKQTL